MKTIQSSKEAETTSLSSLTEREIYRRGRMGDSSVSNHPFGKAGYRYYQIEQEHRHNSAGEEHRLR